MIGLSYPSSETQLRLSFPSSEKEEMDARNILKQGLMDW